MKVAVLSGKGGTGKTFVSVNLARVIEKSIYMDCDVEEPNGALFLKPKGLQTTDVFVEVPDFDKKMCTGCRACVDFCRFHALAFIKERPMLFPEVCHNCAGCRLVCPSDAVTMKKLKVGEVSVGDAHHVRCLSGKIKIGQASGIPILKELFTKLEGLNSDATTIIDCPPGSGCMVMETVRKADYCILVTEPTVFGVHNLNMVVKLVKLYHKPFGVVINKNVEGENPAKVYCEDNGIPILEKIPFHSEIAKRNAVCENLFEELEHADVPTHSDEVNDMSQRVKQVFQSIRSKVVQI